MFSGQGSQYEGMGLDIIALYPALKIYIDQASDILHMDMLEIFNNPKSLLNTKDTQLMMVIIHKMYYEYLVSKNISFDGVLGFSLGEMSAWHASGIISYKDLLLLTKARAEAMQLACEVSDGMMSAVLKLDAASIEDICKSLYQKDAYMIPVNYNATLQTVISGHRSVYETYANALKEKGAKLFPLQVAGAFHSPLMNSHIDIFKKIFKDLTLVSPKKEMILNSTGQLLSNSIDIKSYMLEQITKPVYFTKMIQTSQKLLYDDYIEIGPGDVLSNLLKKEIPNARVLTLAKPNQLEVL
jgi:[acyl-carrier-protein] S-malonyltransferase